MPGVLYSAEMKEKAKAQGSHLVTLDINGKFAKKGGATSQTHVLDADELQRVWDFFEWLTMGRHRERSGRADATPATPAVQ
jgi:hypothetical protein